MDPFAPRDREDLRAISTRTEQMRDLLDTMAQDNLKRAADLGYLLERLSNLIDRMDHRLSRFDDVLRDVRLTMTGIGSLAKSLAEKQQTHEDILRAVKDILAHLTQKASTP